MTKLSTAFLPVIAAAALGGELAAAQTQSPPPAIPPPPTSVAQPAAAPRPPAEADEEAQDAIVVTGRRPPGAVVGDIKPEVTLSPADIQSYGVSTVAELLDELSPETRSDRGRGGEAPVVLLNGHRISSFNEIRDIPTEAILRVEILPEEVALKYGYTANQRVVNIVLRRYFRATTAEGTLGAPTQGHQVRGQAEGDLFHLRRDNRLNIDLRYTGSTAITDAARGLVEPTSPFDAVGNVAPAAGASQVDPNLSALVGAPVSIAGVPASAAGGRPALSDFVGTANRPNVTDVSGYRTLVPTSRGLTLNATEAMPGPLSSNVTLNGTLGATETDAREGLAGVALILPAGDPYSPFSTPVRVLRYDTAAGALRQVVQGWTGHLSAAANRDTNNWRFTANSSYDHADSVTTTDAGVDVSALQALLDARSTGFNPFAPLPTTGVASLPRNTARSFSDSAAVSGLVTGNLFSVPAGKVFVSLKVGDQVSRLTSRSNRQGAMQSARFSRNDLNAQFSIDLPALSHEPGWLGVLGDLSFNANAALDDLSDFGTLPTYGFGANWTPLSGINLIVSQTHDKAAPSQQQLGAPLVATPGVTVFDYATGRTAVVTVLRGGSAQLVADSRTVSKIALTWKPLDKTDLTLSANYVRSDIRNAIASFPAATAEIEAAYPGRFVRDASGALTQVDYRPVNFADQARSELRWGMNLTLPIGPAPPAPPDRPRRPEGDGERRGRPEGGFGGGPRDGGGRGRGSGFGGSGFGGGGFGGFNGGAARAAQQGRLQVVIYHTYYFTDRILARPGGPVFDLLNGSAAGSNGGQPRQEVEAQFGYTRYGYGVRLSADWRSATTVDGGASPTGALRFSSLATVNLRLFDGFSAQPDVIKRWPLLSGARLSIGVNNLFDARQSVRNGVGAVPLSYQPAYLDPVGRVVSVTFRKLLF